MIKTYLMRQGACWEKEFNEISGRESKPRYYIGHRNLLGRLKYRYYKLRGWTFNDQFFAKAKR